MEYDIGVFKLKDSSGSICSYDLVVNWHQFQQCIELLTCMINAILELMLMYLLHHMFYVSGNYFFSLELLS